MNKQNKIAISQVERLFHFIALNFYQKKKKEKRFLNLSEIN